VGAFKVLPTSRSFTPTSCFSIVPLTLKVLHRTRIIENNRVNKEALYIAIAIIAKGKIFVDGSKSP